MSEALKILQSRLISNKSMFFEEFALKRHVSKFPINGKNQRWGWRKVKERCKADIYEDDDVHKSITKGVNASYNSPDAKKNDIIQLKEFLTRDLLRKCSHKKSKSSAQAFERHNLFTKPSISIFVTKKENYFSIWCYAYLIRIFVELLWFSDLIQGKAVINKNGLHTKMLLWRKS